MIPKTVMTVLLFVLLQTLSHAQQTYQLDTKKSKILWNTGRTMGGHNGYLLFSSGSLFVSPSGEPLSGSFKMDMNSMKSIDNPKEEGNLKTDATLRTEGFFDVQKHPTAAIVVKKITRIGSSTNYKVAADLTIKGITHPIEFTATILTKENTTLITANTEIHRQYWNIDFKKTNSLDFLSGIPNKVVSDEIYISLNLVLDK